MRTRAQFGLSPSGTSPLADAILASSTSERSADRTSPPKPRLGRWQPFSLGDRALATILLLPAALLLGLIVLYPVARLFYDSFFALRLTDLADTQFIGWRNYLDALSDPMVVHAAKVTLLIVLVTVPGALLLGLGLAFAGNVESSWRWPVRLALLMPWAMPPGFVGMIFGWFFHTDYGVINDLIVRFGGTRVSFLLSENLAFAAVCVAAIWKSSSFVALLLLAGLQSIDRTLFEVALVEGASPWQRFRHITLPLLLPSIWVALIFRTLAALQMFDIAYGMTQGGPGNSTETLAILINKTTTEFLDVGYGSTLAVLLLAVSLVLTAPYLRRLKQRSA